MANDWYNPVDLPVAHSRARAATIAGEFKRVSEGVGKLPTKDMLGNGRVLWGVATEESSANAIVLDEQYDTEVETYGLGHLVFFKVPDANTGPTTLKIGSAPAVNLLSAAGTPLQGGELPGGWVAVAAYEGNHFRLLHNALGSVVTIQFASSQANIIHTRNNALNVVLPSATSTAEGELSYSIIGDLPSGLSFDAATRTLSGTPDTVETTPLIYEATVGTSTARLNFTISIVSSALVVADPEDIDITQYERYDASDDITLPEPSGGLEPYTLEVTGLPSGIVFSAAARRLTGQTLTSGSFAVTYRVSDSGVGDARQVVTRVFNLIVEPAAEFTITAPSVPTLTEGAAMIPVIAPAAQGGLSPYTYAMSDLPSGLSFDAATRTLSGTPDETGSFDVTYSASDSVNRNDTAEFTITVIAEGVLQLGTIDNDTDVQDADDFSVEFPLEQTTVTLPTWTGNAYILIAQPEAQNDINYIGFGVGNSISAFTKLDTTFVEEGVTYEVWRSNQVQGAVISGDSIEIRRPS